MEAEPLWPLVELLALAGLAGWASELLFDTGLARPLSLIWGLIGVLAGGWIVEATGWQAGPTVAGYPVLAALAGTLLVCLVVKVIGLGLAASR
jgi:uncharacterized membrane protein YeaQ/YmgE (transglycosylase-associated protein family)